MPTREYICWQCHRIFASPRKRKTCGDRCRQALHRAKRKRLAIIDQPLSFGSPAAKP